mmetsp:Transcript_20617/g.65778  ORF Transcript_20617/g.65778 Transcript_20617/m.65778 type:complete len:97 (+) Transcript_20617:211-501(+)|eukprot:CAMPEP_0202048664 /NCGR_PEP_ID=MMETSP0963-20130614/2867_1 /ASSEMBLY_ACC=CAM_ASM_000494 /TAXON_ID=4773 /ORGANISM="Schizochytrium aggregatum, Strain ATCC28209" /LENGTH=96 /DNA_ID=CAMNT_0048613595 /DNA_START=405 /DNA_END=695 /DNA_ORIENTATION=-
MARVNDHKRVKHKEDHILWYPKQCLKDLISNDRFMRHEIEHRHHLQHVRALGLAWEQLCAVGAPRHRPAPRTRGVCAVRDANELNVSRYQGLPPVG